MMPVRSEDQDQRVLDLVLQRIGPKAALMLLADSLRGKANHVKEKWQDHATARKWGRAYSLVKACAERVPGDLV